MLQLISIIIEAYIISTESVKNNKRNAEGRNGAACITQNSLWPFCSLLLWEWQFFLFLQKLLTTFFAHRYIWGNNIFSFLSEKTGNHVKGRELASWLSPSSHSHASPWCQAWWRGRSWREGITSKAPWRRAWMFTWKNTILHSCID